MLEDKIYRDFVAAMKAKDQPKKEFLSFIRAALKNQAIELRKEKLDDAEVLSILKKQQKRLLDTKEASASRPDLVAQAESELGMIAAYLPKPLEESQVIKIIEDVISELGASTMKDMGKVMKEVTARLEGRADSKTVSGIVREKLQ